MKLVLALILAASSAASATQADVVSEASGAALQADVRRALELIGDVDPATLSLKDRQFVTCMRGRFSGPGTITPASAALADRALAIYQNYWRRALTQPETRQAAEVRLEAALRGLLRAKKGADLDELLAKSLEATGWHSLEGRTGLLRELMLWKKQDEKTVPVALPGGEYKVHVYLLNSFKSFGWSYYATCGRRATGGWTTDEALFAVVPRYDSLDSEEFKVSFLGHEAQHFADKGEFKNLKPWELEYRAKLTELSLANATRGKVLEKFVEDQGDDPASPHSYADRKILEALIERLDLKSVDELATVGLERLQAAARETLSEDSQRRRSAEGKVK